MKPPAAAIAAVRPDRQLEILDGERSLLWGTASVLGMVWGAWLGASDAERALYSWPTWDPEGKRVAAFRAPTSGTSPELVVLHGDGVRTDVLWQLGERIPIYAQWSPDGTRIAVLYQLGDRLGLTAVAVDGGEAVDVVRGSPLFFTWVDPTHVAVFVGQGEQSRIGLIHVETRHMDPFPGVPGNFCAPILVDGRVGYVAHHGGHLSMWLADRAAARELEVVTGLVALLPRPGGGMIARAIALDDRSPYRRLGVIDLADGSVRELDDRPLTAFFWSPTGRHLVLASTDPRTGWVSWTALDVAEGTEVALGDVRPTRDLRFYLRFFEQFAQSHPLIDPSGAAVLVPGELASRNEQAGLWSLPLDGGEPERIGDALLGVWGPPG